MILRTVKIIDKLGNHTGFDGRADGLVNFKRIEDWVHVYNSEGNPIACYHLPAEVKLVIRTLPDDYTSSSLI